ncbi:MAG: histidine phosphatase family protein [Burkholderiales bacterium]|nr:histidine phosphatase family protein [Burkholderiales bacterium]
MDLILWRHAEASESAAADDLSRPLTTKGQRQAERMAEWLNRRLAHSARVLVSPALRCQQTAKALGRKFKTLDAIAPGASPGAVLEAAHWPEGSGVVLIVGHQPTLGLAASLALAGIAQPWSIRKAAVWWIRHRPRDDEGHVVLQAVQSPDCL